MNYDCKSDEKVIPILMHLLTVKSFASSQIGVLQATCDPTKCDLINDFKLFPNRYTVRAHPAISHCSNLLLKM